MDAFLGLDQTRWFVELIQARYYEPVPAVHLFEARAGIGSEAFGHSSVGLVQLLGQFLQRRFGGDREIQHSADRRTSRLPTLPLEQLGARVAPTLTGVHKDVAAHQTVLQACQGAEGVEAPINRAIRLNHQPLPRPADDFSRRWVHLW